MKRFIKVSFQKEGVHMFPGADTDPKYATGDWDDVSFLGYPHRHIFHFYVTVGVEHNDRDIEFIQLKRELLRTFDQGVIKLDHQSCEMVAESLINCFAVSGVFSQSSLGIGGFSSIGFHTSITHR